MGTVVLQIRASFWVPKVAGHPDEKDPERDPISENCPQSALPAVELQALM